MKKKLAEIAIQAVTNFTKNEVKDLASSKIKSTIKKAALKSMIVSKAPFPQQSEVPNCEQPQSNVSNQDSYVENIARVNPHMAQQSKGASITTDTSANPDNGQFSQLVENVVPNVEEELQKKVAMMEVVRKKSLIWPFAAESSNRLFWALVVLSSVSAFSYSLAKYLVLGVISRTSESPKTEGANQSN